MNKINNTISSTQTLKINQQIINKTLKHTTKPNNLKYHPTIDNKANINYTSNLTAYQTANQTRQERNRNKQTK